MNTSSKSNFACRFCQHYSPEGRRGGHCQRLGAPVSGEWKACSLMIPSFSSAIEVLSTSHQQTIKTYKIDSSPTRRVLAQTV